jgi:hypothetical protein
VLTIGTPHQRLSRDQAEAAREGPARAAGEGIDLPGRASVSEFGDAV